MKYSMAELILMARERDAVFNDQMTYWLEKRKLKPSLGWMMSRLSAILGKSFLMKNAFGNLDDADETDQNQE